ncbi:MAG TPA: methyltransferase [Caulobacteraceae bacterium]|jgi:SAM-dependent methyltransferase|nr:methyltransferase [Caulobacteraceae bacterium]
MTETFEYQGGELELFQHAHNWKRYLADRMSRRLHGAALEVGAGLGGTTAALCGPAAETWLCLEPDRDLEARLEQSIADGQLPAVCRAKLGTVADLADAPAFDSILYVDVLEHIEDDAAELERAAARLKSGGRILVMSPAHPWLYSPFDAAIGHFRRYRRSDAQRLTPGGLRLDSAAYLDSVGLLASAANKLVLRSATPSLAQIVLWDRWMVPVSRLIDPLLGFNLGKSILFVWRKP